MRTAAPLPDPDALFGGIAGIDSWSADALASYILTVTDPAALAPTVTRALVAADTDVMSISESRHSLEDVYLELVDGRGGGA